MIQLMFISLLQAVAGPLEGAPAQTDPAAAAASEPSAQQQAPQPQRVRCRRERLTGTRLASRVCTTPEQDQANTDDARQATERFQSQMPLQGN